TGLSSWHRRIAGVPLRTVSHRPVPHITRLERFCLSLRRHPPTSTLFPYTTLFRSREARHVEAVHVAALDEAKARFVSDDRSDKADRKSTRLNSSHDQISYAVFCLKKKKRIRRGLAYSR